MCGTFKRHVRNGQDHSLHSSLFAFLQAPFICIMCGTVKTVLSNRGSMPYNNYHSFAPSAERSRPFPTIAVSYTHLRAHETRHDLVCRLLLEKKKKNKK